MSHRSSRLAALVVASSLAVACAPARAPTSSADVDPKLRQSTFIEEGSLVALVVSTRPTRFRLTRDYIPVEIAVANKGLAQLTMTRESFTLRTADGQEYAAVGREELSRGYGSVDVDRRFLEAAPAVQQRFSSFTPVPSNMSPGFDQPIARDHLSLPRFSYILDMLYFPRPPGEIVGRPLELFLRSRDLPDPVFVRFEIVGQRPGEEDDD